MTNDTHRPTHHFHIPAARSIVFVARRAGGAGSSGTDASEQVAVVYGRRSHPGDKPTGDEVPQLGTALARLHLGPGKTVACEEVAVEFAGFTDYDVVIEPIATADPAAALHATIRVDLIAKS